MYEFVFVASSPPLSLSLCLSDIWLQIEIMNIIILRTFHRLTLELADEMNSPTTQHPKIKHNSAVFIQLGKKRNLMVQHLYDSYQFGNQLSFNLQLLLSCFFCVFHFCFFLCSHVLLYICCSRMIHWYIIDNIVSLKTISNSMIACTSATAVENTGTITTNKPPIRQHDN